MKKRVAIGCLALFLLLMATLAALVVAQGNQMDQLRQRASALAVPTTYAELAAAYPAPPADENAAGRYGAAATAKDAVDTQWQRDQLERFQNLPVLSESDDKPAALWTDKEHEAVVAYLVDQSEALALICQATAMPACRFVSDLSAGPAAGTGYLMSTRQVARLLSIEARAAALDGRTEDAVAAIQRMGVLAHHLRDEPLLMAQNLRIAVLRVGIATAESVMSSCELTETQLKTLSESFHDAENTAALRAGSSGEFVVFMNLNTGGNPITRQLAGHLLIASAGEAELDLIEALEKSFPTALDEANAVRLRYEGTAVASLAGILVPALTGAIETQAGLAAHYRIYQTRVAIERYRLAHGAAPDTLDVLVPDYLPAIPTDPFDGEPLRYRANETGGYTLYSIGENRSDENGALDAPKRTGDIGIEITP